MASKSKIGDNFTILYFATATAYTKKSSEHIPAPLEVSKLFEALESRYPGMKAMVLDSCAVTLNMDYIYFESDNTNSDVVIKAGDEVAIIPPVSSG